MTNHERSLNFWTGFRSRAAGLSEPVIGRWHWEPPSWIEWSAARVQQSGQFLAADLRRPAALLAILAALAGGAVWYRSRPKPHYVTYEITPPQLTQYNERGISFIYPLEVQFKESAAQLLQLQKVVTAGIDLSPKVPGAWTWVDDKRLVFTPKSDWPVDTSFTVSFTKKGLFAPGVLLEDYGFDFRSQPFTAKISR